MTSFTSSSEAAGPAGPPIAFLLTVASFVVIETVVALVYPRTADTEIERFYAPDRVPAFDESVIQWQTHRLLAGEASPEIVFLGDSSCLMGVRPEIVAEATGAAATSFCTIGWIGIDGHADMLEAYLQDHRAPRQIVYHVAPFLFETADAKIEGLGRRKQFRGWLEAVRPSARATGLWGRLLDPFSHIPSTRLRHAVRRRLLRLWGDEASLLRTPRGAYPSDDEVRRTLEGHDGWMIEARVASFPAPTRTRLVPRRDFEPSLRRLFGIAVAHGSELVLVMNPQPEANRSAALSADYEALASRLRELAAPYAGVTVRTPLLRHYRDGEFVSEPHLNQTGAERNSREIATWLGGRRTPD